ncbi:MAG: 4Fe-4S dicluster domain-containing protein [Desulfofustis sp.]|nr:4Fe-4S dicluster domain-containing protein [Desulfofustis sp.]
MEKEDKGKPVAPKSRKRVASRSQSTSATAEKGSVGDQANRKEDLDQATEQVVTQTDEKKGKKTLYQVVFFYEWCKSCGICSAMCPVKIIMVDELGHPYIDDMDACIGCRNCEIHCPDFAITVKKRYPERRKTNGVA